ncbi:MAG: hypothetical protein AAGC66_04410 [Leifsonia sp.]
MATRWVVADLRTGDRLMDIPVVSGDWDDPLNTAESLSATISVRDPQVQKLAPRSATTPAKTILAALDGDTFLAGGPIWARRYDRDKGTVTLGAAGMQSIWDHRLILTVIAQTLGVNQFIIPDPTDPKKTIPNPQLQTAYTGLWLGTILKRVLQQAMAWTGGALPIIFQPDETSTNTDHDRTIEGTEFRKIGDFIRDTTRVIGGPEVNFQGRLRADRKGIEFLFQTGTGAQPLITSTSDVVWNLTAPKSPISNFQVDEDATGLASVAWQVGGRSTDTVLTSRQTDSFLTDAGFPLLESFDSSHTDVSKQATLDGWAAADLQRRPLETWSFDAQMHGKPSIAEYAVGDFHTIRIAKYNRKARIGDPWFPQGGDFRRRLVGRSGTHKGDVVKLQFAPALEEN